MKEKRKVPHRCCQQSEVPWTILTSTDRGYLPNSLSPPEGVAAAEPRFLQRTATDEVPKAGNDTTATTTELPPTTTELPPTTTEGSSSTGAADVFFAANGPLTGLFS
eukprot:GHVU01017672.1.p1 GENE.GHVU01017672.1~~GHVU01017672.1.p1  ORF type:complete len:107 (-),score=13.72 GHVU01017672.1:478-798(-)